MYCYAEDAASVDCDLHVQFANNSLHVALNLDKSATTAAGMDSGASDAPNPFASLERMLESRMSENNLSGLGGAVGGAVQVESS